MELEGQKTATEMLKSLFCVSLCLKQLTPIERYALHYLEYLHISDDEAALKVRDLSFVFCT